MPALPTPGSSPRSVNASPMNIPGPQSRIAFSDLERRVLDGRAGDDDRFRALGGGGPSSSAPAASLADARDRVLRLCETAGRMCGVFRTVAPRDASSERAVLPSPDVDPFWLEPSPEKDNVAECLCEAFRDLFVVADACGVDMCTCILKKVELNGKKYPVELCKGKSGKYTNYSDHTGITTTEGQCTIDSPTKSSSNSMEDTFTVEGITLLIRNFARERLWSKYHTPRNIVLALFGEAGELAELFQWRGDEGEVRLSEAELDKIGQEIADVSIYLLRLADVCHVRLGELAMQLMEAEA
ncbi:hypothetical protein ACHAWF_017902 [Thalassiosira exigua]